MSGYRLEKIIGANMANGGRVLRINISCGTATWSAEL